MSDDENAINLSLGSHTETIKHDKDDEEVHKYDGEPGTPFFFDFKLKTFGQFYHQGDELRIERSPNKTVDQIDDDEFLAEVTGHKEVTDHTEDEKEHRYKFEPQEDTEEAQSHDWFKVKARDRDFEEGDLVLLTPDTTQSTLDDGGETDE